MKLFRLNHAFVLFALLATDTISSTGTAAEPADAKSLRWYKGNTHTHSLWSDGNDFPEMIAEWYKTHDYHFLALSDHNILSRGEKWIDAETPAKRSNLGALERYQKRFGDKWVEIRKTETGREVRLKPLDQFRSMFEKPGEFLMIEAEEITDSALSKPVHINASNLVELIRPQGGATVREAIANNLIAVERQSRRVGRPILAHVNHPNFGYAVTAEDLAAVVEERFFEIYNGHPGVNQLGDETHVSLERMWDIANTIRIADMKLPPLNGLATDDSHNYEGPRGATPGRGWIMVKAAELTPDALINAVHEGSYYASSGVVVEEFKFQDKQFSIAIAPQQGVEFVTQFVGTPKDYDRSNEPVRDQAGKEIDATRRYSADVGQVFAEVSGNNPSYKLTGKELYVRAVVNSSKPHPNPSYDGQHEQAWIQPVGWK